MSRESLRAALRRLVAWGLAAAGSRAGVTLTSAPESSRSRPGWPLGQAPADAEREPDLILDSFVDDFGYELECTHCGGEGTCDANENPLWDCDVNLHPCHSCGGSGKRRDQRVF
jgi:hypothetical protein